MIFPSSAHLKDSNRFSLAVLDCAAAKSSFNFVSAEMSLCLRNDLSLEQISSTESPTVALATTLGLTIGGLRSEDALSLCVSDDRLVKSSRDSLSSSVCDEPPCLGSASSAGVVSLVLSLLTTSELLPLDS